MILHERCTNILVGNAVGINYINTDNWLTLNKYYMIALQLIYSLLLSFTWFYAVSVVLILGTFFIFICFFYIFLIVLDCNSWLSLNINHLAKLLFKHAQRNTQSVTYFLLTYFALKLFFCIEKKTLINNSTVLGEGL